MDSVVSVTICDQKKTTSVKKNTDSPFYNEYFVFEFFTNLEKLLDKSIEIKVIQPGNIWKKRKLMGYVTMDIATVWYEKNHQFYHKWAILSTPKTEIFTGPRGYIKVDIAVLTKGEVPTIPTDIVNDDIEGNLLLPEGKYTERQKAKYIFDIYKCENVVEKPSNLVKETDFGNNDDAKGGPSTYVEISFAGISVKTSTIKGTSFPVFNEQLTIIDLFPPLCQRIKIEVCYGDQLKKTVQSFRYINLRSISNDKEEGFLPTLGPIFLHLYTNNHLEGYAGTIIMAMNTELEDLMMLDTRKPNLAKPIPHLDESLHFTMNDTTLFGCIFEVYLINKKYGSKPLSILMTFGKVLVQTHPDPDNKIMTNMTIGQYPSKSEKHYYHLKFHEKKECLWIKRNVPYFKKRVYHSNILDNITRGLKMKIDEIQNMLESPTGRYLSENIKSKLRDAFDYVIVSGKKYLDIVSSYDVVYQTQLDVERRRLCLKEITNVITEASQMLTLRSKIKMFRKLMAMYHIVGSLVEDIQDCWPDIYLWIVQNHKKIGFSKIAARDLIYSPVEEEKGRWCGIRRTVNFYPSADDKANLLCVADIYMLLFLNKHKDESLEYLPKGFHFKEEIESMPRIYFADEQFNFQLKAHIFQGQVSSGFDQSGLADAFARVIFVDQVRETQCSKDSLNPMWDETLTFKNVTLYGSKDFIQKQVKNVVIELWDKDPLGIEYIGRVLVQPLVHFSNDANEPIILIWQNLEHYEKVLAQVLCGLELNEVSETAEDTRQTEISRNDIARIPAFIKPELREYKIEVLFWGVRKLEKINLLRINRPRISIICQNHTINSDIITNAKINPNFPNSIKTMTVVLPTQSEYAPPLRMKIFDSRKFGIFVFAGIHITHIDQFLFYPTTVQERESGLSKDRRSSVDIELTQDLSRKAKHQKKLLFLKSPKSSKSGSSREEENSSFLKRLFNYCFESLRVHHNLKSKFSASGTYEALPQDEIVDSDDFDWWTKFYASLDELSGSASTLTRVNKLKVYGNELESQPEFNGFSDMLHSFELYKGKRTGDDIIDDENVTAVFKGSIKIYRWPLNDSQEYLNEWGWPLEDGVFEQFPENTFLKYSLRVYCVRALGLRPMDLNGKSDPYLCLTLNDKELVDKQNAVGRNVNPVFGRCFEFDATFPQDHSLKVAIWDADVTTSDDLIGETEIDLEKRYVTKHRAQCGLAGTYEKTGYCAWRGIRKPTTILAETCRKFNLPQAEYSDFSVRVCNKEFFAVDFTPSDNHNDNKEVLALNALRRWNEMPVVGFCFVPEHVETRSLYHPSKPGIEQGKIQLWVDILPVTDMLPPEKVDITPRKPIKYELRVIVWNTADVLLDEDDFFTGERKSDIFVKGWLIDSSKAQYTDVHYRSLSGEGNFNWRFVFPFEYLPTENKIVIRKKESLFAREETDSKIPCTLNLQIWDNDNFSQDDFLGVLTLDLAKLHRPAKSDKKCTLSIISKNSPKINLFKIRRTKGWWPFRNSDPLTKEEICAGKIEAELEIFTEEEAKNDPAGMGRKEPQALPAPNRPDTSFIWFKNPLKALRFVFCKLYRKRILCCLFLVGVVLFGAFALYAFPGYTVKKLLGAK